PYTTLFRSLAGGGLGGDHHEGLDLPHRMELRGAQRGDLRGRGEAALLEEPRDAGGVDGSEDQVALAVQPRGVGTEIGSGHRCARIVLCQDLAATSPGPRT